jgi:uncharacterized protein
MTGRGFSTFESYNRSRDSYSLLPFRYMRLDDEMLLVNEVGEHVLLSHSVFHQFVRHQLAETSDYEELKAKHFLSDSDSATPLRLLSTKLRTKKGFLAGFTKLHIFVVTLRCDHSCHYCQVSRVSLNRSKYDMTAETADQALDLVFQSPARDLKIEFQGGEPLLNFDLIQHIVERAETRAQRESREISFVVTTNLSFINDEILAYLKEHHIAVSTSLDGPAFIHNTNRPRPGNDAYESTIRGIERVRNALGRDAVSALMTTTRLSLDYPEAIVDEYASLGFPYIFLRPISPYGFALRTSQKTGYDTEAFVQFYKRALDRVIEVNRSGQYMAEIFARVVLTKMLTPFNTGYVDLRSPTGAGIAVVVYNYDGDVYATDESRMLAEMGDKAFRLGSVYADRYQEIFDGPVVRALVGASCVESLPGCSDCALHAYCGADPIENYATQDDIFGHRPTSRFCARNMEIIKHLLRLYHGSDEAVREILWSWVTNAPRDELLPVFPD